MIQINTLLELRKQIKNKKPNFIRQDYQRRKRLGRKLKWRKPKGIHSKIRHHFKGRRKMPSPGFKSPRKVKGLHSSGLRVVNIMKLEDINKIQKENEGIIISKNIGTKKRLEILRKAKELNIKVLNLNIDNQIKKIEDFINSKTKEVKKENKKEKKKADEEKTKTKAEETKEKEKDKKEAEEKQKVLTKRI